MLECRNLKKTYFNKIAVDNISLDIEAGKIYALLGPNGSGKTTFMKMIAGLVKPSQGILSYKNQAIGIESKREVAYMSTEPYFYSYKLRIARKSKKDDLSPFLLFRKITWKVLPQEL